jgi:recombination protein RecR
MAKLPESISRLTEALEKLPGIGEKSALRLALFLAKQPDQYLNEFSQALKDVRVMTKVCTVCFNYASTTLCPICNDPNRDKGLICVVPTIKELLAIEGTNSYKGLYHVLQGLIDPMNGVAPELLKIKELFERLKVYTLAGSPDVELILALGSSVEASTTALYLNKFAKVAEVKITEIAYGVSVGSEISHADPITIEKALAGRREL